MDATRKVSESRSDRSNPVGDAMTPDRGTMAVFAVAAELNGSFLQAIVNAVGDPLFVKDQDHRWVAFNAAFERMLGRPRDELLGRSDYDFVRTEEADVFWRKDEEVFRSGRENLNEEAFTGPDGRTHTVQTRKTPFVGPDGRKYLVAVIHDITGLKDTETALRRSERLLAETERMAHLGSWEWDVRTDRITWSEETYRIFGVTPQSFDATRDAFVALIHPDDRARVVAAIQNAIGPERTPYDLDMRVVRPDGTVRTVHSRGETTFAPDGQSLRMAGTAHDVTEARLAEHVLRSSEQRLRRHLLDIIRVIGRTIEARDPYTAGHEERVAALAVAIGRELGLSETQVANIEMGALIHDVGKIYVPGEILTRPGRLTKEEYDLIKTHARIGYEIVKGVDIPATVTDMILQHHERLDGTGYPQGLRGDAIRLEARILAVADVVESMAAHRPYRPSRGIESGLAEVLAHRGTRYDERAVDACVRLVREKAFELPNPRSQGFG